MATIITREVGATAKGSPLTNAEIDDNFVNLNTSKLEASNIIPVHGVDISTDVTGNVLIDVKNFSGNCKNTTGTTIPKGTPVYQTGVVGVDTPTVAPADAADPNKMPAIGVAGEDLAADAEGDIVYLGNIKGVDTSAFGIGDEVYVASGGGYTNTRPANGSGVLIQFLGVVNRVSSTNGSGIIFGTATAQTQGVETTDSVQFARVAADNLTLDGNTLSATGNLVLAPTGYVDANAKRITNLAEPTSSSDAATKQYVDAAAEGLKSRPQVRAATTSNLSANYNNGTGGVGATLTSTTNGAFPLIDGVQLTTVNGSAGLLVRAQTAALQNGRYNLTDAGSASTPWVLTRCGLCDQASEIPGSYTFVQAGTLYANTGWVQTVSNPATFTVGTDAIMVVQFSGAGTYTASTGLVLSGTQFLLANTTVTAGTYGSSTQIPQITVNAQGQVTSASNNSITVGAGDLTVTTSGTGLTGSGTFNANSSSNQTITISSNATSANTGSTIVARDASGNFTAGTITAALTGNASTATALATARTIGMTGDVSWTSAAFNGSGNVTGTATLANTAVNPGTYGSSTQIPSITVDGKGRVTAVSNNSITVGNGQLTLATGGIATGSQTFTANQASDSTFTVTVPGTNIAQGTRTTTAVPLTSSTGTGATLSAATASLAGVMSSADKTKLDGIAAGAQVNTVTSVAGKTGAVTLVKADVGLGSVDNTADSAKSVLEATRLTTARTIGGVSFNGTANINLPGVNIAGDQNTSGAANFVLFLDTRNTNDQPQNKSGNRLSADFKLNTSVNNPPVNASGTYSHILTVAGWDTAGGSGGWPTQLSIGTQGMAYRQATSASVWGAWTQFVTNNSGTWSINITGSSASTTGNAATATTLQTARTIGGVSFNGSANINLPGVNIAGNQNTTGNAATATTLQTARTINGVSFNGSANITVADATKLPLSGGTLTGALTGTTAAFSGDVTASSKIVLGNRQPVYSCFFGGGTDLNWKKIADVTFGTALYSAAAFKVDVIDADNNFGASANVKRLTFYVSCRRSAATLDSYNDAQVYGPLADYVRAVKTATGVYQLQVRTVANYRHVTIVCENVSSLGATITYASPTALVNGSTTGTIYLPTTGGSADSFVSVSVASTLAAAGAITQAGNQVLHAGNYNSYAPTKTGGGASGSWGISITGNAATATALQTARTINGVSFNGSANITVATAGTGIGVSGTGISIAPAYSPNTATELPAAQNLNTYQTAGFYYQTANADTSTANNYPVAHAGSLVIQKSAGVTQQYYTYGPSDTEMYFRSFYSSVWGTWRRVLTSSNYNSFAPTLTGTGASGSWGISVTGNAATATTLQTARTINGVSFNGSANITVADATKLPLAGGTVTGRILLSGNGNIAYSDTGGTYIPRPLGGSYKTTTATLTGALTIQLPTAVYAGASDMLSFWVDIYDYNLNESVSIFVYGYPNGSVGSWANCGATILTPRTDRDYNVRFGHDGTRQVVCIGEVGSTWSYPQVVVRDVQAGFSANVDTLDDGWGITFLTTLPTVIVTSTGNTVVAKQLQTARTIGGVSFDGTANINLPGVNTTGNQNTTGSAATLTTARTIGGVSFNGSANINLPGVNTAGNQSTTGNAATATTLQTARTINGVSFNGSANITVADATKLPLAGGTMTGDIVWGTNDRDHSPMGTYDSSKTQQIWSMGAAYRNSATGANFGNLYGAAYQYSASLRGIGHQFVWVINGSPTCALGSNIWTSGNVTAYSDERLKKDWAPVAEDFVERLAGLKHGSYTRIDSGDRQAGVSAQALQKLLPETVMGGEDGFLSVAYGNAALVAAVELAKVVVELKSEISLLKAKLDSYTQQ